MEENENKPVTITLPEKDIRLVVKALEKLPSADLGMDLLMKVVGDILRKPVDKMSPEEKERYEKEQRQDALSELKKREESKQLKESTDLVKAKILVALEG